MNLKELNEKLGLLDLQHSANEVIKRVLANAEIQNWCGEGCRGDCKGGGFFD